MMKTHKNNEKNFLFTFITTVALFAAYSAYNTQSKTRLTGVLLANIEALTQTEVTKCPDPYDVPNRFIEVKSHSVDVECSTKGTLTVCGTTFNGSYEKGKKYPFTIAEYNCSGSQSGSCCKQSDVRVEVVTGKSA